MIERCKHCKYEWRARVRKPKQCPRCKRYNYNKKEKPKNE